ncbi:MAG: 50S ribosomal protein L24 [Clostridiales bacterium]|nr:50S ribosomal protein L24 [Clostridiales bacterium]
MHVKTGDTVMVITGSAKGTIGKVLEVAPKKETVIVEGAKMVKKHKKSNNAKDVSGIIDKPAPIHCSDVMLYCTKCKKATRISVKMNDDGSKVRVCKHCGATIE